VKHKGLNIYVILIIILADFLIALPNKQLRLVDAQNAGTSNNSGPPEVTPQSGTTELTAEVDTKFESNSTSIKEWGTTRRR
jgi:hypothetical protein